MALATLHKAPLYVTVVSDWCCTYMVKKGSLTQDLSCTPDERAYTTEAQKISNRLLAGNNNAGRANILFKIKKVLVWCSPFTTSIFMSILRKIVESNM